MDRVDAEDTVTDPGSPATDTTATAGGSKAATAAVTPGESEIVAELD